MPVKFLPFDDFVFWDNFSPKDKVFSWFSLEDWHKIVHDLDGDQPWASFLERYPRYYRCYVLRRKQDNESLGFVFIINEDLKWKTVSIHGGAAFGSSVFERYRGFILMISSLLGAGIKVRTAYSSDNVNAMKFNKSIGFVKYREIDNVIFAWINRNRLISMPIYKRLYGIFEN